MMMMMMFMMIEDSQSICHQLSKASETRIIEKHDDDYDAYNDNYDDDGGRVGVIFRSQLSCKAILASWLFSAVFPILKINVSS